MCARQLSTTMTPLLRLDPYIFEPSKWPVSENWLLITRAVQLSSVRGEDARHGRGIKLSPSEHC